MPAIMNELMETLKERAVYLSSKRRSKKLNNKINTPWYKKMSNTLL
jgi:hypothetical protein